MSVASSFSGVARLGVIPDENSRLVRVFFIMAITRLRHPVLNREHPPRMV